MCKWCCTLTPLAAALRGSGSRRRFAATSYAHSTNRFTACRLTSRRESAGRGHPKLESRAHLRARADHPEFAEFGDSVRRAQQAHANTRPMPACGPVVVARLRREPRSHAVDGPARPDATDRSQLRALSTHKPPAIWKHNGHGRGTCRCAPRSACVLDVEVTETLDPFHKLPHFSSRRSLTSW